MSRISSEFFRLYGKGVTEPQGLSQGHISSVLRVCQHTRVVTEYIALCRDPAFVTTQTAVYSPLIGNRQKRYKRKTT